jgi:hypothetical protein
VNARSQLWASNCQSTTSRSQVLDHSVRESVHSISIRPTKQSCLQLQIHIEIWMGRRIVIYIYIYHTICISPSTSYYIYLGNKKQIHQIQGNNNLRKKWLKINILQSVELGYQWTTVPFFGGHYSIHAFQQKSFIGLCSSPRTVVCNKNIVS